jgi:hypothetical protein
MMHRLQGWPELLADWVERNRARPFVWGEWDCVLAAADCVQTITGEDTLAGLRWDGVRGALRQLEVEGGLEAAVTRVLGEPVAPAFAQRGDVLLIGTVPAVMPDLSAQDAARPEFRHALAICLGETCVSPGRGGLVFPPTLDVSFKAWMVGRG